MRRTAVVLLLLTLSLSLIALSSSAVATYHQEVGDGGIASIGHGNTNTVTTITGGRNQVEIKPKAGEGLVLTPPKEEVDEKDEEKNSKEEVNPTGKTDSKEKGEEKEKPRQKEFPWAALWITLGSLLTAVAIGWIVFFRVFKDDDEEENADTSRRTNNPEPKNNGGDGSVRITDVGDANTKGASTRPAITNTNPPMALPPSEVNVNYGGQGLTLRHGVIRVIRK